MSQLRATLRVRRPAAVGRADLAQQADQGGDSAGPLRRSSRPRMPGGGRSGLYFPLSRPIPERAVGDHRDAQPTAGFEHPVALDPPLQQAVLDLIRS